jgi:hypothetical protein
MSSRAARMRPQGALSLEVLRRDPLNGRGAHHPISILVHGLPRPGLSSEVNAYRLRNIPNLFRGLWRIWLAVLMGIPTRYGAVFHRVQRGRGGAWIEYGLVSLRVVTDAGVAYLAACMDNTSEPEVFKYHGYGTGTTAEAVGDTALVTELTTQYATDNTRPTGSQAHSTNTYTTVATLSPDSGGTIAVTEHGVFSQAANSGGTLLDRSKFAAVNLVASSDSLQTTYVFTLTSGG